MGKKLYIWVLILVLTLLMSACGGVAGDTETEANDTEKVNSEIADHHDIEIDTEESQSKDTQVLETQEGDTQVENTQEEEKVSLEVEEIVEFYREPDIIVNYLCDMYAYYQLENKEVVEYYLDYTKVELTDPNQDPESYFTFRWAVEDFGITAVTDAVFDHAPEGKKHIGDFCPLDRNNEQKWRDDLVIAVHTEDTKGQVIYLYSVSKKEIVATYYTEGIADQTWYSYTTAAFLPDINQAVFTSVNNEVYTYANGVLTNQSDKFKSLDNKKRAMVKDGKVIILEVSEEQKTLASYVYDPTDGAIRPALEEIGGMQNIIFIGGGYIPKPGDITEWSHILKGGYASTVLDGKYVIMDLMDGTVVEAKIELEQYSSMLDIDEKSMLLFKNNGHWRIVDKETGEIILYSSEAIKIDNDVHALSLKVSVEGDTYFYIEYFRDEMIYEFYNLGYRAQD